MVAGGEFEAIHNALSDLLVRRWALPPWLPQYTESLGVIVLQIVYVALCVTITQMRIDVAAPMIAYFKI